MKHLSTYFIFKHISNAKITDGKDAFFHKQETWWCKHMLMKIIYDMFSVSLTEVSETMKQVVIGFMVKIKQMKLN